MPKYVVYDSFGSDKGTELYDISSNFNNSPNETTFDITSLTFNFRLKVTNPKSYISSKTGTGESINYCSPFNPYAEKAKLPPQKEEMQGKFRVGAEPISSNLSFETGTEAFGFNFNPNPNPNPSTTSKGTINIESMQRKLLHVVSEKKAITTEFNTSELTSVKGTVVSIPYSPNSSNTKISTLPQKSMQNRLCIKETEKVNSGTEQDDLTSIDNFLTAVSLTAKNLEPEAQKFQEKTQQLLMDCENDINSEQVFPGSRNYRSTFDVNTQKARRHCYMRNA